LALSLSQAEDAGLCGVCVILCGCYMGESPLSKLEIFTFLKPAAVEDFDL
jgi:hypothetical protein